MFPVLMKAVPEEKWPESMHVVRPDGRVRSAGDAVIELMKLSPRTRPAALAAQILPPVRARIRRDYERLASRRGELSDRVDDHDPVVDPPRVLG